MDINFFNKEIEILERKDLEKYQLKQLKETVDLALQTSFYKKRLTKAGIKSSNDIKSLEDIKKIPYTNKEDLRDCYPFGLLTTSIDNVVRLHTSSGTTGIPTVIYHTQQDLDNWTEILSRSIVATGVTKSDVFQNMMTYGMFTGGLGLHYGAENLGCLVIPSSSGNTKRQLQLMKDFKTTVLHATPSYMFHLSTKIKELGFDLEDLSIKKAFLGGEPHSENTRKKLEDIFDIDIYNSYGLSEMNGPGVGFECVHKNDIHIWEDSYIMEAINPETKELIPDGEEGEIVFTTLRRTATPILRYRTRDLATIHKHACPCGRTHRRISRIIGRTDDMLIINGANVFPSQIEQVIMDVPEVGTNYQILLSKEGDLDKLTVQVEIRLETFLGSISDLDTLKGKIREDLRASIIINPKVELHEPGSLPVFELKAKRVTDTRPKI